MVNASLCFSGFSRDELDEIQQLFAQANRDHRWTLVPEPDAQVLVIDMDSMYGHMTWLKAHSGGKLTVGLTAGERSETDHLLARPISLDSLESLLARLTEAAPVQAAAAASQAVSMVAAPEVVVSEYAASPSADYVAAVTTGQMAAIPANLVAHQSGLSDFLAPGALAGPSKLQLPGAPVLAFDPDSQTYCGSATLKPLLPCVEARVGATDFTTIDAAEFERIRAASGGAQPYLRLLWFCGLALGHGQLFSGFTPARRFVLTKWPQIEREFPKHFRLATVMMKGPALVREIAELAGVAEADVTDFINAGLLTGSIVVEGEAGTGGDPARACAILARPRAA